MAEPDAPGPTPDPAILSRLTAVETALGQLEVRLVSLAAAVDALSPSAAHAPAATPRPATTVSGAPAGGPAIGRPASVPGTPAEIPRSAATPPPSPAPRPAKKKASADLEGVIAGRWLNRGGLVAVGLGVTYFLKYAIDNAWIGPAGQVAIGLLLGAALLASVPWFTRRGYAYFGDGFTGLGAALLYASIWAGGSYYQLYSLPVAFGLMSVVTSVLLVIAIRRNAQAVAVIALVGGFLSPILVSSGADAEIALFTYLAILDASLVPIARLRRWHALEWPAFLFTQIYFWAWFVDRYRDAHFAPTALFASIFFAVFLVLPALEARAAGRVRTSQALLLVLNAGTCLIAFAAMLWTDNRWDLTAVALALAAVHVFMARAVPTREGQAQARLLFAGLALALATLVVPIRLHGRWITMAWAVEGAILVWTGFRAGLGGVRGLGLGLLFLTGFALVVAPQPIDRVFLNGRFATEVVTVASIAAALWFAAQHHDRVTPLERPLFGVLGVAVNVLAIWALTFEVQAYFELPAARTGAEFNALAEGLAISLLWTVYAIGLLIAGVKQRVAGLRWQALALLGGTTIKVFFSDTASLQGFYRIVSAIVLGIVLLVVSFVYQRRLAAEKQ